MENRGELDEQYPIGAYLFTITRRLTLNVLRKDINYETVCRKMCLKNTELHNETEEAVIGADLQKLINDTVKRFPVQQQLIFSLSRNEGLSHQEIAEKLNISKNTVRNHIVEALKKLRMHFNKSDIVFFIIIATYFN
jgi:RNA polymerase sigma factor (sigma-70 family)